MSNIVSLNDYEWGRTSMNGNGVKKTDRYNPYNYSKMGGQQAQQSEISNPRQNNDFSVFGMFGTIEFAWKSFSTINLIIIWLMFLITFIIQEATDNYTFCILYNFGAQYMPSVRYNFEIFRYITPNYLHLDWIHIASNTYGLILYGYTLEKEFGTLKFTILYMISNLGGNLLSGVFLLSSVSVGASTSLFGLFALMLLYLIERRDISQQIRIFYILYVCIITAYGFFGSNDGNNQYASSQINYSAHIGGFFTGALITTFFYLQKKFNQGYKSMLKYLCIIALIGCLSGMFIYNQTNNRIGKPDLIQRLCVWN